jgi:alkylhydroperoxidase family enzyme
MKSIFTILSLFVLAAAGLVNSARSDQPSQPSDQPKPVPQTRTEIKQALERLKHREPRFPLPPPASEEVAQAGKRLIVNNGRARRLYLPADWFAADFGNDPAMTLEYPFKTQCFWVVSRANNCHYCLGHQEQKLLAAGLTDNQIGLLDSDWKSLDPRLAEAVRLSRRMTLEPHLNSSQEIKALQALFSDAELTELVYTIAMFNSVNRWTDAMGLPQDELFRGEPIHFDSPTAPQFDQGVCLSAPTMLERTEWESWSEVLQHIEEARTRQALVELPSVEEARTALQLPADVPVTDLHRALSRFPKVGAPQLAAWKAMEGHSELPIRLKALIAFVTARENRSWTSLQNAIEWLNRIQVTVPQGELIGDQWQVNEDEFAALQFARKLTATPQQISDADVAEMRRRFSDKQAAEIIFFTAARNQLDRFTETLALSSGESVQ